VRPETGAGGRRSPLASTDSTPSARVAEIGEMEVELGLELELWPLAAMHFREGRRGDRLVAAGLAERAGARAGRKGSRRQAVGAIAAAALRARGFGACSADERRRGSRGVEKWRFSSFPGPVNPWLNGAGGCGLWACGRVKHPGVWARAEPRFSSFSGSRRRQTAGKELRNQRNEATPPFFQLYKA